MGLYSLVKRYFGERSGFLVRGRRGCFRYIEFVNEIIVMRRISQIGLELREAALRGAIG